MVNQVKKNNTLGGAGSKSTSLLIPKFMLAQQNLPMSNPSNNLYISIATTPVIIAVVVATAGMMWPVGISTEPKKKKQLQQVQQ